MINLKQPYAWAPMDTILDSYCPPPLLEQVQLDIPDKTVWVWSGRYRLGDNSELALESLGGKCRKFLVVASFLEWLENHRPPWAEYQAFMDGRIIGIDNHPGVKPAGFRETWRKCMANCVL